MPPMICIVGNSKAPKTRLMEAMAGADTVAITSSVKFAVIKNINVPTDIDEICDKYFDDNDIVLVDGFTLSDKPRIIVVEKKEDAAIFEKGCRVISVTDGNIGGMGAVINDIMVFLG